MHSINARFRASALAFIVGVASAGCRADSALSPEEVSADPTSSEESGGPPLINTAITSTSFRNMPSGMTAFAEIGFSGSSLSGSKIRGVWAGPWYGSSYFKIPISDASAPGAPYAGRTTWPNGLPAGKAPLSLGGWDRRGGYSNHGRYRKLYISLWLKIPTKDYQNQSFGTKLFYLAHGNTARTNADFLVLKGTGRGTAIMSNMNLAMAVSRADHREEAGSQTYYQNTGTGPRFAAGSWHQVELYLDVGTANAANGTVRIWVDGTKVMDHTNKVKFLDSTYSFTQGFYDFLWTPVWGGSDGARRTRSDAILMDHILIAGVK